VVEEGPADPLVRVQAQQVRSRATLERILSSAGQLFDEIGFEATTMEAIAIRAEVSIGSVYRFFNDKQSLILTLAERWRARCDEMFAQLYTPGSFERDADAVILDFITWLGQLLSDFAGARALLSAAFMAPEHSDDDRWTREVERFIDHYAPGLPPARRRMAAHTYKSVTSALMVAAINAGPATERHLREARSVLGGYIHELGREASEATSQDPDRRRGGSDSVQRVRKLGGIPER
jgi:AcrR family transcriptional regulator